MGAEARRDRRDPREERKEKIYAFLCDESYVPMRIREIAAVLQISREKREELREALEALVEEGRVQVSRNGRYAKSKSYLVQGIYTGNPRGFGFVTPAGEMEDIFIPPEETGGAMHKDTVQVLVKPAHTGKRREGRVTAVLERGCASVVGTYQQNRSFGFVVPDDKKFSRDLFIPQGKNRGAVDGHKVVARITDYGGPGRNPEGEVTEILGHIYDPGVDILSIVRAFDLPAEFPEEVLRRAERQPDHVSEADCAGRKDLRDWLMVTIDGEDSRDLDDAVSLCVEEGRCILGVHIADVANYVQENSALDREARRRGTSIYLADRVIPMLPHRLSNGICSLNAGEDRLALSCIMEVDGSGRVVSHEIAETVIRVDERMTYTNVQKLLERSDAELERRYAHLLPMLDRMKELSGLLRARRQKRGGIDFDFPEAKAVFGEDGKVADIVPYERTAATELIEDFMLLANETVAEEYYWREIPFVYRTHETPDPEKIRALTALIYHFGYTLHPRGEEIHPKEIQKLLAKIADTPQEAMIARLALRSMKQARYMPENAGHFGLAAKYYCHFTSPIRRYPDLQIHRIIKDTIRGRMNAGRIAHYGEILDEVCKISSETERRADEAERETMKQKKAEYMQAHLGESFAGVISGVSAYGFYVELPNTVEGMVHITRLLDDSYEFREDTWELTGVHNGKSYKLGQRIRVRAAEVNLLTRTIDFEPEEETYGEGSDKVGGQ